VFFFTAIILFVLVMNSYAGAAFPPPSDGVGSSLAGVCLWGPIVYQC